MKGGLGQCQHQKDLDSKTDDDGGNPAWYLNGSPSATMRANFCPLADR